MRKLILILCTVFLFSCSGTYHILIGNKEVAKVTFKQKVKIPKEKKK